jgi:hypothetical protein
MNALPNIYKSKAIGNCLMLFGVAAFVFFIFCAQYIYQHREGDRTCSFILGALWVVGSPAWFFVEHFFFFKRYGDPAQYEQFKRAQELASKIWAGGILVLAAAWSGGDNFPQ